MPTVGFERELAVDMIAPMNKVLMKAVSDKLAEKYRKEIRILTPVDTGRLKGSINVEVKEVGKDFIYLVLSSDVEYSVYVEFGTQFMQGQFMFTVGMNSVNKQLPTIIRRVWAESKREVVSSWKRYLKELGRHLKMKSNVTS